MAPRVFPVKGGAYITAFTSGRGAGLLHYDFETNSIREIGPVGSETGYMAMAGHRLLFANADPAHGYEVWVYDEETNEFGLLADLWPGPESSSPGQFYTWGDRVLFQARTQAAGLELWISDGTAAGTKMVCDINPGTGDSDPYGFVSVGKWVFFRAKDDACGRELWVTDGTSEGTMRVADIMPGPKSSEPYNMVAHKQSLYFTANDGVHGEELWQALYTNGKWLVKLVQDLYPGATGSEPHQLQWSGNRFGFFLAKVPDLGETICEIEVEESRPPEDEGPQITAYAITASKGGT